jgi:general L-amino acid transport system permease protein
MNSKNFAKRWLSEIMVCALFAFLALYLSQNILAHFKAQNINFGFKFLTDPAGFDISETFPFVWKGKGENLLQWKSFSSGGSYFLALATALFNSIKVTIIAAIFASILGILLSLFSSSKNRFLRSPTIWCIRFFRSVPLLVQLIFWYVVILELLPEVAHSFTLPGNVFLNNRGLFVPGIIPTLPWGLELEFPELVFGGRNIAGGWQLSPEFLSLVLGLGWYSAGYIGEVLRSALVSLPKGQIEAATSLGMSNFQAFRFVLFPQALQRAVPPLVSQYLNLFKNTSLGVAVGFPDFVSVGSTSINQTGQAFEIVFIWIFAFLILNVLASLLSNGWNKRVLQKQGILK